MGRRILKAALCNVAAGSIQLRRPEVSASTQERRAMYGGGGGENEERIGEWGKWGGGLEGLCILLRRLSYPTQNFQLGDYFGRGSADISIITNTMLSYVYDRWNRHLVDLSEHTRQGRWLSLAKLQEAAAAVHCKGPLSNGNTAHYHSNQYMLGCRPGMSKSVTVVTVDRCPHLFCDSSWILNYLAM